MWIISTSSLPLDVNSCTCFSKLGVCLCFHLQCHVEIAKQALNEKQGKIAGVVQLCTAKMAGACTSNEECPNGDRNRPKGSAPLWKLAG